MTDELLTVAEVATLLKLNQQTVRNMIDRRELGAVRVGTRRVRVRQSQLDAFLAAGDMARALTPETAGGEDEGRWQAIRKALDAVVAAVDMEDRDALAGAIADLSHAARTDS